MAQGVSDYPRTRQLAEANARYRAKINQQLTAVATSYGRPWTPQERAVALDRELTAGEAARRLGRTLWAVKAIRKDRWRYE